MDGYNTLHEMLGSALKQAGEESGMLLGQDLSISLTDSLSTNKTAYFGDLDDAIVPGPDGSDSEKSDYPRGRHRRGARGPYCKLRF